ncbi:12504_t:CDS:2 [Funneliformis caledonium]|uniref:12504_t:CDS:1 n=1 Tax=Funneliformis caledonium TaxID=1117310 RepID=A0A9N9GEZ2_9GLOM|nr:12504_t:CDS:2 [Funneliformis caledonium]
MSNKDRYQPTPNQQLQQRIQQARQQLQQLQQEIHESERPKGRPPDTARFKGLLIMLTKLANVVYAMKVDIIVLHVQ